MSYERDVEKQKPIICPRCKADITGGYDTCHCAQRDKRCPKCKYSWHKCGLDGLNKTGHPCIWCLGGTIRWFNKE